MSAPAGPGPAPASEVPLACHLDPDQWFDRTARTASLAACLACPYRRWCARRALRHRPSWGMWAGVWIDGRFAPAARYLDAIAADTPLPRSPAAVAAPPSRPPADMPTAEPPVGARCSDARRAAPKPLVWARSSGHCEIMSAGCGLSAATVGSRVPDAPDGDASVLFAVCLHCAKTLHDMDSQMARRLGYRLDDVRVATSTPFLWRQAHRLLLGADGSLHSATDRRRQPETVAT